jgi:hypothetical protein
VRVSKRVLVELRDINVETVTLTVDDTLMTGVVLIDFVLPRLFEMAVVPERVTVLKSDFVDRGVALCVVELDCDLLEVWDAV